MSIARKSMFGFAGQLYTLVIGLGSTILVARLLGPEGKGVLAIIAAITSLGVGVASFGLGPALGYMAGKRHFAAAELASAALVWSLVLSALLGAVIWFARASLLAGILKGMAPLDLAVVLLSMPAYYLTAFLAALFVGHGRVVILAAIQSAAATVNLVAIVIASIYAPRNTTAVVVALSVAAVIAAVMSLIAYRSRISLMPRKIGEITRSAAPYAMKSYVGQATSMFFLRADVFFLNYFAGPAAVGVYSVATNLAEKLWLFSNPISNAVYSEITGAESRDAADLTTRTSRALLVLNGLAGLVLVLVAIPFVPLVYGTQFADATIYLALLVPGVIVYAVCQPYGSYFVGQLGRPEVTSTLSTGMMILSAILYVALIPVLGPAGAAIGSTLSYSSALLGYLWLYPRETGDSPRDMLVPTAEDFRIYRSVIRAVYDRVTSYVRSR